MQQTPDPDWEEHAQASEMDEVLESVNAATDWDLTLDELLEIGERTTNLARVFNADRVLLDVHIRADAQRKLPEFPDSPWSRVREMKGDDAQGYVATMELTRYDGEAATARIPDKIA